MTNSREVRVAGRPIIDRERNLSFNRGVFIDAPPDFFAKYGTDMAKPEVSFQPKIHVMVKINDWKGRKAQDAVPVEDGAAPDAPATEVIKPKEDSPVEVNVRGRKKKGK